MLQLVLSAVVDWIVHYNGVGRITHFQHPHIVLGAHILVHGQVQRYTIFEVFILKVLEVVL